MNLSKSILLLLLLINSSLSAQVTLYDDPAGQSYTNIDDAITDVTPAVDISNCTTVEYSVSYEFPLGWEGSGNMESSDECNFGDPCLGDPEDPEQGNCFECWDFMWIQFFADGDPIAEELIGEEGTFNIDNMGTFTFIYCRDEEEEAHIEITNQNWASAETNIYTNVYILCLEGIPVIEDLEVGCSGGQIDLIGSVDDDVIVQGWEWTTDGPGIIDFPQNNETFITGAEEGDLISLEATDQFGCMGTSTVEVMLESYDVDISGGGIICENACSDDDSDLVIEIDGGVPLYDITLVVNGITVPGLPSFDINEEIRICNDIDAIFPEFDDSESPPILILPSDFFPISIEITEVVDADGCEGNINNGSISYDVESAPEIEIPVSPDYCVLDGDNIDLTVMDEDISPDGFEVLWYEDNDLEDPIFDPSAYPVNNGSPVYAVVDNGDCQSLPVEVELGINFQPSINIILEPIVDCAILEYVLPDLDEVVDITNANNPGYYLDENGMNGPVTSINPDEIDEIYIYDASAENCFDQVLIPLDISEEPDIESPLGLLTGCGELTLPTPEGSGFDMYNFNTEENGTGTDYQAGDIVNASDGINNLYLTVTAENGCSAVTEMELEFESSIDYEVLLDSLICADSLILPEIIPDNGTVAFFTASQGMGVSFRPGDVIYTPFNDTLYVWDPELDSDCAEEDTLSLQLTFGPEPIFPSDTAACDILVLPEFGGITGANIRYAQFPVSNPNSSLYPGDTIDFGQTLFVLDTIGDCLFFDSMNIQIFREPFVGTDTSLIICEGFDSGSFDLMELLSNPALSGQWNYPVVPDFNPQDSSNIFFDVLPPGNYSLQYVIEDSLCGFYSTELNLEVVGVPYAGENNNLNLCTGTTEVDFMALVNNPDTGGIWTQVSGPQQISLIDTTSIDLSGIASGNYVFLYVIEGEAEIEFCEPESSSLFIDIGTGVQAGSDTSYTACLGEIIELISLLSSDADNGGIFEGENIIFNGTSWNTGAAVSNQEYFINYIVQSQDVNCPSDTSTLSVTLIDEVSAGSINPDLEFCEGDEILLSDIIENETEGGIFYFVNSLNEVPGGIWTAMMSQDFLYIIDASGSCPPDSLEFNIETLATPRFDILFSSLSLCIGSDDNFIDFTIVNENNLNINYEIRFYNNGTNELALSIDSLSSGDIEFVVSGTENFTSFRNDTVFLALIDNSYRFEVDAFSGSNRCQDEENIFTWIDISPSYTETIQATLCEGQSIDFRGIQYQSSSQLAVPGSGGECDSIFTIDITNIPQIPGELTGIFCDGDTLNILGRSFTMDRTGTELFRGAASSGCDSIINLDIEFESSIIENISQTLCPDEELTINNIVYDFNNPTGSDTLQSIQGCDSIISINLDFYSVLPGTFNGFICPGEIIMLGNDVYDENNLSGTTILQNASINACDSIINVNIEVLETPEEILQEDICPGEFITVGMDNYDEFNAVGTTILQAAAENGCDSIVMVELTLLEAAESFLNETICPGQTLQIGNDVYDENNPQGISLFPGAAANGCDSIIMVELSLLQTAESFLNETICPGQTLQIGNDVYDESNLQGISIFPGAAANGCDSIVMVQLSLEQAIEFELIDNICSSQSLLIGADIYDQNNLSGTTQLQGQAANGCDSIVMVELSLIDPEAEIELEALCPDQTTGIVTIVSTSFLEFPISVYSNQELQGEFSALPVELELNTGNYTIEIEGINACSYQEFISISSSEEANIAILSDVISENNFSLNIFSSSTYMDIIWNSSSGILSCTECESNTIIISEDTEVFLTLISSEGCSLSTSIILEYTDLTREEKYYIPNIIDLSDPENNRFSFYTDGSVIPVNLRVYDRWGNLVIDQDAINAELSWNGRRNNKELEQGVYIYSITIINDRGDEEILLGQVTLIR